MDGGEAGKSRNAPSQEWSWEKRNLAVQAACSVTTKDVLEGRPEALQTSFEHAAAVMRLTLAHKDSKAAAAQGRRHFPHSRILSQNYRKTPLLLPLKLYLGAALDLGIASRIQGTLIGLLGLRSCTNNTDTAKAMLSQLTPGVYGCAIVPKASDALKPHPQVLEATMAILSDAPVELQPHLQPFFENCFLQAPDKAPPRAMLANACGIILTDFTADVSAQMLHFLAVVTYSPSQSMRSLALQCMENMALLILDEGIPQVRSLLCVISPLFLILDSLARNGVILSPIRVQVNSFASEASTRNEYTLPGNDITLQVSYVLVVACLIFSYVLESLPC